MGPDEIVEQPRGTNCDLPADGHTHIVTLLRSTVPECIDTNDPNFYIRQDLLRVAAPLEFRDFLSD